MTPDCEQNGIRYDTTSHSTTDQTGQTQKEDSAISPTLLRTNGKLQRPATDRRTLSRLTIAVSFLASNSSFTH